MDYKERLVLELSLIHIYLYSEYGVKRGLRDEKGQGVLTGLTNISDIKDVYKRQAFHLSL